MTTLRTVGHGMLTADGFTSLLGGAQIRRVVDVRSFPGGSLPHRPTVGVRVADDRLVYDVGITPTLPVIATRAGGPSPTTGSSSSG